MEFVKIHNRNNFLLSEIPIINPFSRRYNIWWKLNKKRCIEGLWSIDDKNTKIDLVDEKLIFPKSDKWRYIPPTVYFYVNFGNILRNKKGTTSGAKRLMRPNLDDIEWEFGYNWIEARGFSGFEFDDMYSCNTFLLENITDDALINRCLDEKGEAIPILYNNFFKKDGSRKEYIPCKKYIRQLFNKNLGRPVYGNVPKNLMILGTRDGGKDLFEDQTVRYQNGEKIKIKYVQIGDKIYGSDGKLTTVLTKDCYNDQIQYEVEFLDNRKIICGGGHLWEVTKVGNKNCKVVETKEMFKKFIYSRKDNKGVTYIYKVKQTNPIDYNEKDLPIHPYILGALLGDGTMTTLTPKIACNDLEILEKFKSILGSKYSFKYDTSTNNNYTISYNINTQRFLNDNPLKKAIFENNLNVKGEAKYIPELYKTASIEQRLELVKGLMDTDGSSNKEGSSEFTNKSKKLIDGLAEVLRSLGIKCQIGIDNRTGQEGNIKGHKYIRGVYYRLYINTTVPIFHVKRKLENQLKKKYKKAHDFTVIKNIKKLNVMPSVCIGVDAKDNCFLTDNYVVTHNSYLVANQGIAHELLFDGLRYYDNEGLKENLPIAEIVVGAAISDKSRDLLNKVKYTLDNLPGAWKKGTSYEIPCPLFKHMGGSISPNKDWRNEYQIKRGGDWKKFTGSFIKHRIFTTENPEAAAGGRPGTIVLEEVGLISNLLTIQGSNEAAQNDGGEKFGSSLYIGTAGNMEKILEPETIFNEPAGYDFLEFDDVWENTGKKICWFIPATHMSRKFKDKNGNTKIGEATKFFLERRKKKKKGVSSKALDSEMMNYPMKPSEMFLNKTNNKFPIADVKIRIRDLSSPNNNELKYSLKGLYGINSDGKVNFEQDKKARPIYDYPLNKSNTVSMEGCIQIFEPPIKNESNEVPNGIYIAGLDPINEDGNDDIHRSLQSFYLMNLLTDRIVVEYTGRTKFAKDFYEQIRRILIDYNATLLYENQKKGIYTYFDQKNCLYLLEDTPIALRDIEAQRGSFTGNKSKGVYATPKINFWGQQELLPNYLESKAYNTENNITNLQIFKSIAGLKEMVRYNGNKINTDRISSLGILMIARELKLKTKVNLKKKKKRIVNDSFFNRFNSSNINNMGNQMRSND